MNSRNRYIPYKSYDNGFINFTEKSRKYAHKLIREKYAGKIDKSDLDEFPPDFEPEFYVIVMSDKPDHTVYMRTNHKYTADKLTGRRILNPYFDPEEETEQLLDDDFEGFSTTELKALTQLYNQWVSAIFSENIQMEREFLSDVFKIPKNKTLEDFIDPTEVRIIL